MSPCGRHTVAFRYTYFKAERAVLLQQRPFPSNCIKAKVCWCWKGCTSWSADVLKEQNNQYQLSEIFIIKAEIQSLPYVGIPELQMVEKHPESY